MYIKDALGRDLSIVKFITDGSTTSSMEYFVYGTDRVARVTTGSSGSIPSRIYFDEATYFLYDHLGNTRVAFMVNGSNVPLIVNALDYYSYGKILREYDNGAGDRYLTTGHERDKETGLDYRGARYYDSDVARFLSLDPMASKYPALSAYVYVANNPVILVDEDGQEVKYSILIANAMAARGEAHGYTTNVVANPNKPGDYGVSYSKTVNGKFSSGTQYEGKFTGIADIGRRNLSLALEAKFRNNSADLYSAASNVNTVIGTAANGLELSSSSFRLTNGIKNGSKFSPKVYASGWGGGSRASISTYKTASLGGFIGKLSFGLGAILDIRGALIYKDNPDSPDAVHPVKAAVNTGVGAFALELNPIAGIVYTGVDALYPGGWVGLGNDQDRLNKENKAINPEWQLWPGAMKQ